MAEDKLVVGQFGSCYGIRGWVRLISFTESPTAIFSYRPWYIKRSGHWQLIEMAACKSHSGGFVVSIVGINSRDEAASLVNSEICVDRCLLPPLKDGEFYWEDLIGCSVITTDDYQLGEVTGLMETGANDVLIVKARSEDSFKVKERLLPLIDEQVIKSIDLRTKIITVFWDPAF